MQDTSFYQHHLDQVSRSFAFCIARLKEPLRTWVGLSYLLCRALDTAEDAAWDNKEEKIRSLEQFKLFLQNQPTTETTAKWVQKIPKNIKKEEHELLQKLDLLLNDLHNLPENVKIILQNSIISMNQGMTFFSKKNKLNELRLLNLSEVNTYCFFVAGLVGELLTNLLRADKPTIHFPKNIYLKAHHFGLFLQKINLLKDQSEDKEQGRFLIPERAPFLASLAKNAKNSIDYILSIPASEKEFRLFCAWSLFLGLSSLSFIENSFLSGLVGKIPRSMTEKLLSKVESLIESDQQLLELFNTMLPQYKEASLLQNTQAEFSRILPSLYEGFLTSEELADLGII